jgi:hypothetical protein
LDSRNDSPFISIPRCQNSHKTPLQPSHEPQFGPWIDSTLTSTQEPFLYATYPPSAVTFLLPVHLRLFRRIGQGQGNGTDDLRNSFCSLQLKGIVKIGDDDQATLVFNRGAHHSAWEKQRFPALHCTIFVVNPNILSHHQTHLVGFILVLLSPSL